MKKVLSLVLALAMVLGSFSFVSAAPMSDVTDPVLKKAVDRLALLEVLTGYPDGTFKPEQTITRAEFAAVAVRVKGLEDAANAAKGLATGFTDVAPSYWASGYVGTAGKLGIINGVGNGLFAPNAPVKYEEAITMIVRALGYEAEAQTKGGYPYGYLIVANDRGLLDDVKGTQGTPASRGIVAQITDNALEIPKMIQVGFGSDAKWVVSGSKEHGTDAVAQLLLHDLGVDEIKGHVTNTLRTKSTVKADEVEINGVKYDIAEGVDTDAVLGAGVTAWAKNDVVFSISVGYKFKSAGKDIVFDEDQIIYDRVINDKGQTTEDEVALYVLDDEYDWANKARVYVNNESIKDFEDIPNRAYGRFVLNEDDEVEFAYLFDIAAADTGLVTEIDKTDLEYINLNADEDVLELDEAEDIYVFNKDLSAAKLEDIKENTAVFYHIDADDNYFIIISNETVEGNLDAVRVKDSRITVSGTGIKFEENHSIFSLNDGEDFDVLKDFPNIEDYVDENVVAHLNLVGDTLALLTDAEATSSKIYGVATWLTSARNPVLSVYTAEGKEVDYTFEDRVDADVLAPYNLSTSSGMAAVYFEIDKDGEIKDNSLVVVEAADKGTFSKEDTKKYGTHTKVAGNLYITEDTVVIRAFNSKGELKPSVIKYENIIKKDIDTANEAFVMTAKNKGNDLGLIVFTNKDFEAVDDTEYGILTSDPVRRGTEYSAEIDVFGKGKETYIISKYVAADSVVKGDLIEFELNDKGQVVLGNYKDLSVDRDKNTVYEKVSLTNGDFVTTNKGTYRRTSDTVIYSATKTGSLGSSSSYTRIAKDSILLLIADDGELKVVVDITTYLGGKTVVTPSGVVTYIDGKVVTAAGDVVVTVTLPVANTDAYRVRVINVTTGTAGTPLAPFYGTKTFAASVLNSNAAAEPISATAGSDNKYNVIVEKSTDGLVTWTPVDSEIIETVDVTAATFTATAVNADAGSPAVKAKYTFTTNSIEVKEAGKAGDDYDFRFVLDNLLADKTAEVAVNGKVVLVTYYGDVKVEDLNAIPAFSNLFTATGTTLISSAVNGKTSAGADAVAATGPVLTLTFNKDMKEASTVVVTVGSDEVIGNVEWTTANRVAKVTFAADAVNLAKIAKNNKVDGLNLETVNGVKFATTALNVNMD